VREAPPHRSRVSRVERRASAIGSRPAPALGPGEASKQTTSACRKQLRREEATDPPLLPLIGRWRPGLGSSPFLWLRATIGPEAVKQWLLDSAICC
jgi:hypothetical protein